MATFQFSVLAMIDHFDIDLLNQYQKLGVNEIHYDIIDNDFYPGRGYNGEWINLMHQNGFKVNVHIMARNLDELLAKLPLDAINALCFQIEPFSSHQVIAYLNRIKASVPTCGIAIEFSTPLNQVDSKILQMIDYITLMSVKPGKGGQKFSDLALDNLKVIKSINRTSNHHIYVHLDGGVNHDVVVKTKTLVDNYVSGSYFFKLDPQAKRNFLKLISAS